GEAGGDIRVRAVAPLLAMIAFTVVANLAMKLGAADPPAPVLLGLLSWRTAGGLAAFAIAALFYSRVLQYLPLHVAQSYAAAQFVAVILSSRLILAEPVPIGRWIGISMILGGIVLVAVYEVE